VKEFVSKAQSNRICPGLMGKSLDVVMVDKMFVNRLQAS
jgi:hypothetical protein